MKTAVRYFCWLSFANAILIAGQMLRVRTPIFDYLAAWALLGIYVVLALLFVSLLLAAMSGACRNVKIPFVAALIEAGVFSVVLVSWVNFLRMVFLSHGIHPLWLPARVLMLFTFLLGMAVAPWARKIWTEQLPEITWNMGAVAATVFVFWLVSLVSFMAHTSHKAIHPAPVPSGQNTETPAIIYIVLDAMSSRDMSVYGYSLKTTPHVEELAKDWTVYENANSAGTGTVANLPAVLTGRYPVLKPWSLYGELAGRVKGWLSLPDILRAHGYETVFLNGGGMNPNFFHFENGFDSVITAGTGWYLSNDPLTWSARLPPSIWNGLVGKHIPLSAILPYPYALRKTHLVEPLYEWIETAVQNGTFPEKQRPLFLYMHMLRPHAPYLANEFAGTFLPLAEGFDTFSSQLRFLNFPQAYGPKEQSKVDQLRLRYDENIRKADEEIGRFIAVLKEKKIYDSAMIVITADHGTSFSNGFVGYYSPAVSISEHAIPLLVKFPHQTKGRRIHGLVSAVDFLPTVLQMLKIPYSQQDVDGQPLQRAGADKDRVIYVCNASDPSHSFAVLSGHLKIIQRQAGMALFDLKNDPQEHVNLWGRLPAAELEKALAHFSEGIAAQQALHS